MVTSRTVRGATTPISLLYGLITEQFWKSWSDFRFKDEVEKVFPLMEISNVEDYLTFKIAYARFDFSS